MKKTISIILACCMIAVVAAVVLFLDGSNPKVIILGIDGAEWRIIDELTEQGHLPHIASLIREGTSGELRTFEPILSPIIWTTIATGKSPDKHGVGWFMVENTKTGEMNPITSDVRKVKAIWNIASEQDRTVGVWSVGPLWL